MRFAISIPQFVRDGEFDPSRFRAYMAQAEALGFASAWTSEQTIGSMPTLSPLETMTYAAACTERIRLGCVVFVTPLHSPVHLAKDLSTLDQISRGRVEIGVGTGGRSRMFSAFQVDPTSLVTRFNEGLALMKALWTEPRVDFDGRFWQLKDAAMEPKPFQKPHPPIWFGANHPDALRRAVAYGNGFFGAGSSTTAQFAQQVPIVRHALAEAKRDAASFGIAKRVYIAVDDDMERARQRTAESLHRLYSYFGLRGSLETVAVYGPPDACVGGLREVAHAGAELILLNPLSDDAEQMERLAAEVVPKLS
jgi:probable F420-dependent oxidoreductase